MNLKSFFEIEHTRQLSLFHQAQRRRLSIAIVAGIIGFLAVTQLAAQNQSQERLTRQNPQEMAQIIAKLTAEKDDMQKEVTRLSLQVYKYRQLQADQSQIVDEAAKNLEMLRVSAGLAPVVGPGVRLTIQDPEGNIAYYDLVDVVHEFRAAGAEAISINDQRVTAESRITGTEGLGVDARKVEPPYMLKAIGNPATLEQSLAMPGGFKDSLSTLEGVEVIIQTDPELVLPPTDPPTLRYAKPQIED